MNSIYTQSSHLHFNYRIFDKANLFDIVSVYGDKFVDEKNNVIMIKNLNKEFENLKGIDIYFWGKNNKVEIDVSQVSSMDILAVNSSSIYIGRSANPGGNRVKIGNPVVILAENASISLFSNWIISRDVVLFASGAHAIYSLDGKKKSKPAEIKIGRHVWIGQGARIVQGARIGKNSVIGSYSLVAGDVPNNCTAGGNPAKVLSRDIFWTVGDYGEDYFAHSKINNEKSIWSESTNKKGEIIFE